MPSLRGARRGRKGRDKTKNIVHQIIGRNKLCIKTRYVLFIFFVNRNRRYLTVTRGVGVGYTCYKIHMYVDGLLPRKDIIRNGLIFFFRVRRRFSRNTNRTAVVSYNRLARTKRGHLSSGIVRKRRRRGLGGTTCRFVPSQTNDATVGVAGRYAGRFRAERIGTEPAV